MNSIEKNTTVNVPALPQSVEGTKFPRESSLNINTLSWMAKQATLTEAIKILKEQLTGLKSANINTILVLDKSNLLTFHIRNTVNAL